MVPEADPTPESLAQTNLLIVAGEASGDLHAARMLEEIRRSYPSVQSFGLGGPELRSAGMDVIADSSDISVVGIVEAFKVIPRARQIFRQLLEEVDRRKPVSAVLVDFPEFNLRLARALRKRGVKIVYYISPQIWAWRRRRVRTIAKVIDVMLVVLPFEVDFYRQHEVEAIHVGHPLVDEVPSLVQVWDQSSTPDDPKRIALLPGSRSSEIRSNLPVMLQAAEEMARHMSIEVAVIKASSIPLSTIKGFLEGCPLSVKIVSEARFDELAGSHLALCASGTAALEVGLLTTPMIVVYRVHSWTFLLGRLLVRLPYISLVNLVLSRVAVPELLQNQAVPKRISDEATAILADRDRIDRMRRDLSELRARLGESGASARAAAQVIRTLIGDKQKVSNLKIEEPASNA